MTYAMWQKISYSMAILVSKEPYRSDELIYGVVNHYNWKKMKQKMQKTEMSIFPFIFSGNSFVVPCLNGSKFAIIYHILFLWWPLHEKNTTTKKIEKKTSLETHPNLQEHFKEHIEEPWMEHLKKHFNAHFKEHLNLHLMENIKGHFEEQWSTSRNTLKGVSGVV